jgi:hypothetical protein
MPESSTDRSEDPELELSTDTVWLAFKKLVNELKLFVPSDVRVVPSTDHRTLVPPVHAAANT